MSIANLIVPNDYNLQCNQLTATGNLICNEIILGSGSDPLSKYLELGYTTNWTGPVSVGPVLGLYRQIDRFYSFALSPSTGTSTVSAPISFTTLIPSGAFTPMDFPIWVINNGVTVAGNLHLDLTGQVTIFVGYNQPFSNVGTCGFQGFSVNYSSYFS